jgi:hypothetical protein
MGRLNSGDMEEDQHRSLTPPTQCMEVAFSAATHVTFYFDTSQGRTVTAGNVPPCTFSGKASQNGNHHPVARHGNLR